MRNQTRRAFTLTEMLVSTALVVIMMTMFATVFQIAGGQISTQKGIAENDQRARTLTTVIKADLDKMTYRQITTFTDPREKGIRPLFLAEVPDAAQSGYFYISENDPNDDTDDVLQFTTNVTIQLKNEDLTPYFGKAYELGNPTNDRNQPEFDDGQGGNGAGSTLRAEVCYFLRNGTLHRRILLIRDRSGSEIQPQDAGGGNFFDPARMPPYDAFSRNTSFWGEFDYSAYFDETVSGGPNDNMGGAKFRGIPDLANTGGAGVFSFGRPSTRFGHNHANGFPREFVDRNDRTLGFIGRFTQLETADERFGYPHEVPGADPANNPMQRNDLTLSVDGVVNEYNGVNNGHRRRADDVMMTHVHAFDVEVWDDNLQQFLDLGHAHTSGDGYYRQTAGNPGSQNNQNTAYGSLAANNRVYDTWHPSPGMPGAPGPDGRAPFRPALAGPDGVPGSAGDDDANGTTDDASEYGWPGSDDIVLGLKAIRITIRYYDVSSGQLRELTLVHSFVD